MTKSSALSSPIFTKDPSFGWNETFVWVILFSVLLPLLLLVSILTVVLLGGDITLVVVLASTSDHLQHRQMTESLVVRRKEGEMTTVLQSCSTQILDRAVDNFVYKRRKYPPQCCNEIWWGRCNRSLVLRESHRQLYLKNGPNGHSQMTVVAEEREKVWGKRKEFVTTSNIVIVAITVLVVACMLLEL